MKRSLALLATFALATSAQAVQPSFIDYAPLEPGDASAGGSWTETVRGDTPKPSFVDYVEIEPDGNRSSGEMLAGPQPSFMG
jgi:hypothetical protein